MSGPSPGGGLLPPKGRPPECYELLIRVRQHNYYVPVYIKGVQLDEVEETVKLHRRGLDRISELVEDWTRERGKTGYRDASQRT